MYPHERSLVKRLENQPFALIGVNSDEDKEALKEVLEEMRAELFFVDYAPTMLVSAKTGAELWKMPVGGQVNAGAMSYSVNGKQYVAIAAGSSLFAFGLR